MSLSKKVKQLRKDNNLTQGELGKALGVASTTISSWERGSNNPKMDMLTIMSEKYNLPISYFFSVEDEIEIDDKDKLPLYGQISCGDGSVVYETTTDYIATPRTWTVGGNFFYLKAIGDSMIGAKVFEGDLLLIREQSIVENGEIAAVTIDNELMLKRVYRTNDSFTLISENPKYAPKIYTPGEDRNIRILGKLKKSITSY